MNSYTAAFPSNPPSSSTAASSADGCYNSAQCAPPDTTSSSPMTAPSPPSADCFVVLSGVSCGYNRVVECQYSTLRYCLLIRSNDSLRKSLSGELNLFRQPPILDPSQLRQEH